MPEGSGPYTGSVAIPRVSDPGSKVTVVRRSDCPHGVLAVVAIKALADSLGFPVRIEEILVKTDEDARVHRCLGSPTVRINYQDVEPGARGRTSFGTT